MTVRELLAKLQGLYLQDFEIRDDGDIDPVPYYYIDDVVIDEVTKRVYLIWAGTEK